MLANSTHVHMHHRAIQENVNIIRVSSQQHTASESDATWATWWHFLTSLSRASQVLTPAD